MYWRMSSGGCGLCCFFELFGWFPECSESLGGGVGGFAEACACAGECGVDAVFCCVEAVVEVEGVCFFGELGEGVAEEVADGVEGGVDGFGDACGLGLEALCAFLVVGGVFFVLAVVV